MKRTESKEERINFKNAVKGHRNTPIWLTFLLTLAVQTKSRFEDATDMSRAEPL